VTNTILLGIDPGFAHLGYGALCIATDGVSLRCDAFGLFETEKSSKKLSVLATEDNLRRAVELYDALDGLIRSLGDEKNVLVGLAAEAMSWPRNAAVTGKMGIAWGVVASVSRVHRLPILQVSPQMLKKGVAGAKTATKDEVAAAVLRMVPSAPKAGGRLTEVAARLPKGKREHPFDALAAALVCRESQAVQMAIRRAAA
jgi:Holliday junction resolvasome RuvABC endonuclease subunit